MEIAERLKLVGKMGQKRSQELLSGRDQWLELIEEKIDKEAADTDSKDTSTVIVDIKKQRNKENLASHPKADSVSSCQIDSSRNVNDSATVSADSSCHASASVDSVSNDNVEISVCIRIRPMLTYELEAGYFASVYKESSSTAQVLDPKIDVRGRPKLNCSKVSNWIGLVFMFGLLFQLTKYFCL